MAGSPHVTHSGVYGQEAPSDVHPVSPLATANTAFLGRVPRGPVACSTPADHVSDPGIRGSSEPEQVRHEAAGE
jgi:hypothetical protein